MPEKSRKLTTREFADRTGLSTSTVSQYVRDGKIDGQKESGRWMIPESQLAKFKQEQTTGDKEKAVGTPSVGASPKKGKTPETPTAASETQTYSVEEFSRLTFLTPSGVLKYLKEGILSATRNADGQWRIGAENLENDLIRHLVR